MVCSLILLLAMQPEGSGIRRLFEENLAREERQHGPDSAGAAQAARDLGLFLKKQADRPAATSALTRALHADERVFGPAAQQTLADASELAELLPPPEAEPLWKRAAAAADPLIASRALAALGDLNSGKDPVTAVSLYRGALAKEEVASGKTSARVAVRLNGLAVLVGGEEGIAMLERALAIDRQLLGERHPETSTTEANLAGLLLDAGRIDAALRLAGQALAGLKDALGPENPRVASAAMILATCWRAKGVRSRAEGYYREALAIDEAAFGPHHPNTVQDIRNLAGLLRESGKKTEAVELEKRLPR